MSNNQHNALQVLINAKLFWKIYEEFRKGMIIYMSKRAVSGTDRRTRYTRKAIKDAYIELLTELPSSKITVTEVCRRADINRGTFYLHYEALPDVMEDMENEVFEEIATFIRASLADEDNRQKLSDGFFLDYFQNKNLQKVLFSSHYTSRLSDKVVAYAESLLADLCVNGGQLNEIEAELFATFMIHACLRAVQKIRECPENEFVERSAFINKLVKALFAVAVDPYTINATYNKRQQNV